MERILLVEPNYKNKFPPIGLMKLSTYFKGRGDFVEFCKGNPSFHKTINSDKVFITSLFTFQYDETVNIVNHLRSLIPEKNIFLGGIAATIMSDRFTKDLGDINIQTGQLTSSSIIGYDDNVNIDELPLDYDILDDVEYRYPMEDNFFAYATRGCINKCPFCAVPKLEPKFITTNNLAEQITVAREKYGDRRNILMMDNNILYSKDLSAITRDLISLGFVDGVKNFVRPNTFAIQMRKLKRRDASGYNLGWVLQHTTEFLRNYKKRVNSDIKIKFLEQVLEQLYDNRFYDKERLEILRENEEELTEIVDCYRHKIKMQRYVDFNQGIDARALTDERMAIISPLPIRPFRLAYDNIKSTTKYQSAFRTAYKHGIRHFSNYMLYNYDEKPVDLWKRLENNVKLCKKFPDAELFSFPMRYAPIDQTDRGHIGKYWTKKQLGAMNVILNVTRGVVTMEDDFFHRAYGHSPKEFLKILAMPDDFIKYRNKNEENGMTKKWLNEYDSLNEDQQNTLLDVLSDADLKVPDDLREIVTYYHRPSAA